MEIDRFVLPYSESEIDDLRHRLARTRWLDNIPQGERDRGIDMRFLMDLCAYWQHSFDWKAQLKRLSKFEHFRAQASSGRIHFVHERGKGPDPMPIILTHGWPGSFVEMVEILPRLADPAAHGADPEDAFHVVVPSLPGYGFSDATITGGLNAFGIASLWVELMRSLGYERFAAQGGDIGASVSTVLGLKHPEQLVGIHLNFIPGSYKPYLDRDIDLTPEEVSFQTQAARWYDENGAYAHIQATRPYTAACALNDSPAGLAVWILEKFREWSDCDGDLYRSFTREQLLTNITLYWVTQSIHSSFRLYYEGRRTPLHFRKGDFVRPPCGFAHFPREIFFPSRKWVERGYNVKHWTAMPRGGHFAAAEQPDLLAEDIRTFFRPLRR